MDMNADNNPDSNAANAAPTPTEDAGNDAGNIAADVANADSNTPDADITLWKTIAETAEELGVNEKRVRRRLNADNADNPDNVMQRTQTVTRQTVTGERDAAVLAPSYIEVLRADFAPSANVVAKPDNADAGSVADSVPVSELMPRSDNERALGRIEGYVARDMENALSSALEPMQSQVAVLSETNRKLVDLVAAQNERLEAIEAAHKSSEASRASDAEKAREEAAAREERILEVAREHVRLKAESEYLRNENAALKNRKWWQWGKE